MTLMLFLHINKIELVIITIFCLAFVCVTSFGFAYMKKFNFSLTLANIKFVTMCTCQSSLQVKVVYLKT